jgi:hypothetical protein
MRRRVLALAAAAAMLFTLTAVPAAQADPPAEFNDPIFTLNLDSENWLAIFWNITRDDFCDWVAGGEVDPPPVQDLVPAMGHAAGPDGVFMGTYHATRYLELWNIDDPDNPIGPCEDTAGQDGPWATGYATVTAHDNDLFVSLTRANAFGETGTGTVYDGDGTAWHYSWTIKLKIDKNGEFRVVAENYTLKQTGK